MGRAVGAVVARRLGRCLLELGGNNGDDRRARRPTWSWPLRAIVFAAAGTAGQRCTTLRRLIVHESIYERRRRPARRRSSRACRSATRATTGTLVGPLIDEAACEAMQHALEPAARAQAARSTAASASRTASRAAGVYVQPGARRDADRTRRSCSEETFAPILYVMRLPRRSTRRSRIHNDVPQGLSSAIFTSDVREAERSARRAGSDCGIANVNIGTSGAEIGGAFGGEKATGGGRESGSDAWKAYMRRATNTINYSSDLPLAQGIRFDVPKN